MRHYLKLLATATLLTACTQTGAENGTGNTQSKLFNGKGRAAFCRRTIDCRNRVSTPAQWTQCMREEFPLTKAGDGYKVC
ncbi:MAG: hypothetical protein ABJH85_03865 [Paracoccaceae bacterium]